MKFNQVLKFIHHLYQSRLLIKVAWVALTSLLISDCVETRVGLKRNCFKKIVRQQITRTDCIDISVADLCDSRMLS